MEIGQKLKRGGNTVRDIQAIADVQGGTKFNLSTRRKTPLCLFPLATFGHWF